MRQSSASPIVCFHQSTRFLRLLRRAKALGWLCLGLTSGGRGISRRFSCRCAAWDFCEGLCNPGPQPVFQTMAATAGSTGAERRLLGFPC